MPTALWWGRFDPDYSRNRILRGLLRDLGWQVVDYHPLISPLGDIEAHIRPLPRPDLVWVPCFRQRDLAAARRWADRQGVPVVADPLISAYDKQVFERGKLTPHSWRAQRLKDWEGRLLRSADLVLADTPAHARFFCATFALPEHKVAVVPVGAEETVFRPCPPPRHDRVLHVLFYGSYLPLQGPEVVVEAARLMRGQPIHWTLIGQGPLRGRCERLAQGLDTITFEDWVSYDELPHRICAADVVLGIFGTTPKAGRVIPNKVYQGLACARAVITRTSEAYPPVLIRCKGAGIYWVTAGEAEALAQCLYELMQNPSERRAAAEQALKTYRTHFSNTAVHSALSEALQCLSNRVRDG
jgi:glycosyltransferase involved in cell wall biosynthesis